MKNLFFGLFPFPLYLSLVGTWLVVTTLYVLGAFLFQSSEPPSPLVTGINLLVPFNFSTAFAAYGGFLLLSNPSPRFTDLAYVWAIVPPLTLILILAADWLMHKVGIPRTLSQTVMPQTNLNYLLYGAIAIVSVLWISTGLLFMLIYVNNPGMFGPPFGYRILLILFPLPWAALIGFAWLAYARLSAGQSDAAWTATFFSLTLCVLEVVTVLSLIFPREI